MMIKEMGERVVFEEVGEFVQGEFVYVTLFTSWTHKAKSTGATPT